MEKKIKNCHNANEMIECGYVLNRVQLKKLNRFEPLKVNQIKNHVFLKLKKKCSNRHEYLILTTVTRDLAIYLIIVVLAHMTKHLLKKPYQIINKIKVINIFLKKLRKTRQKKEKESIVRKKEENEIMNGKFKVLKKQK